MLNAAFAVFAQEEVTSYFCREKWDLGEYATQMDVTVIDDNRIEITVLKYMTPFAPMVNFTTVAKYDSGKYVFSGFMDGFENDVFGHVILNAENGTATLFLNAENPMGGLGNVGRLYGDTLIMAKGTLAGEPLARIEHIEPEFRNLAPEGAKFSIEGAWNDFFNHSMLYAIERNPSWGRSVVSSEGFLVDLHSDPPVLEVYSPYNEPVLFPILSFAEKGNRTEITVSAEWQHDVITLVFVFNEDGTAWLERKMGARIIAADAGRNWVYRKYDGPEFDPETEKAERASAFQRTHITTEDLPLLEMANMESAELIILPKGSVVQLLEQSNTYYPKTIGGITGLWSRLVIPDGTVGWVFTGTGLQEVVADTAKSAARLFLLLPLPLAAAGFFFAKKLRLKNRGGKPC